VADQAVSGSPAGLTGLILAGGRSSRMGRPKALLPFGAELLIERQVRLLRPVCAELILVTNEPEHFAFLGLRTIPDRAPSLGPLAGLEAGLAASRTPLHFAIACDMPFVEPDLIRTMAAEASQCDAVVPQLPAGPEPLYAIWHQSALPAIRAGLDRGERSPQRLLSTLQVRWVPEAALRPFGDPARLFFNCNTPEEYQRALTLLTEHAEPSL
jgi:molybdopterin-guanine dinucleotide biosynthesis protein A